MTGQLPILMLLFESKIGISENTLLKNNLYGFSVSNEDMISVKSFWDFINTNVGVAIVTAILSIGLTIICCVIVFKFRQRSEQKAGFDRIIGDKIASALEFVRNMELSMQVKEIYNIDERLEDKKILDFFKNEEAVYPAIMTSQETFFEFFNKVHVARTEYEKYLNFDAAAYLLYLENYCMNIMSYSGYTGHTGKNTMQLDLLGTMLLRDFQEVQKKFDNELVKLINRPTYKVYSLNGPKWMKAKKKIMEPLLENSILQKLINDDNTLEIQGIKAILRNDFQTAEAVLSKLEP